MSDAFGQKMEKVGDKAINIVDEYFDGKRKGTDQVNAALSILGKAVQVRHQDRLREQIDRSQNLRTAQFILDDPEAKREYIAAMHPEIKKYLPKPAK